MYNIIFLVELEKELEREQKAIENKNLENPRTKVSTLKSNALLTKSRKKKVSSKRKSIQNRNKELGRPISLNVIYEEPSQISSSTVKDTIEVKSDISENSIETTIENKANSIVNDEIDNKLNIQNDKPNKNVITKDISPNSGLAERSSMEEHKKSQDQLSTAQEQDACVKKEPAQESLSINDNTETSFYPITDENWESRLPSFDIANPTNHKGEASAPIASGVYYSQISSEDKTTEETKTIEQHQQADIPAQAPADYVPMVQVFEIEPYTEAHWYPLDVVCRTFREQGKTKHEL